MADDRPPPRRPSHSQRVEPGPVRRQAPATQAADATGADERLRHEIDSGRTGDKVGHPDPAMAPLGTDDEAAQGHDEEGLRIAREAGARPPGSKGPATR
jgi:hypothetical protein